MNSVPPEFPRRQSQAEHAYKVKPFIRWAGSKRLIVPKLLELLPEDHGTYFEPFLGGGSLFLAVQPPKAQLGDALAPLVDAWTMVRDRPEELISAIDEWDFNKATFDELRSQTYSEPLKRAAQFLFLNRGAYGGIWRLNRAGKFNVPWSTPKTSSAIDRTNIRKVSAILNRAGIEISCGDFAAITRKARRGDLVFLDPPYSKSKSSRPFIHYNEHLFDWDQQVRLAKEASRLRDIGATVVITNSAHPEILGLYKEFQVIDVSRHNALGPTSESNRQLPERIFVSR